MTPEQILYRAKRKDNREWVEGHYVPLSRAVHSIITSDDIRFRLGQDDPQVCLSYTLIDPTTLGMWTGEEDIFGNKIFTGDIVRVEYGEGWVELRHGMFMIEWIGSHANCESLCFSPSGYKYGTRRGDLQVVGNKWDNPELLKT